MTTPDTPTPALLQEIGDAFNANDIDRVMRFFAEDAVFDHAAGPEAHGTRLRGREAIRTAFAGLFDKVESVHWETLSTWIDGNTGICHYLRTARHPGGATEAFLSVDILTLRNGLIVHKDTYYKQRTA